MKPNTDWFKTATCYHILIDRFAGVPVENQSLGDQPIFCGGNLRGIIDRLPYLQGLGIDTLWLSPFCLATSNEDAYHGYHVIDYQKIDPRFGTMADLERLVKLVHDSAMHLIMDFVPNHVHEHSPLFFEQTAEGPKVKEGYEDWFKYDEQENRLAYFGYGFIPQLNLDHPPARDYMTESALYWLDKGIDGLRLDYAAGPSHNFWRYFRTAIKTKHPGAVLIGEVWHEWLYYEHVDQVGMKNKAMKAFRERIDRDELQKEYIGSLDGVLDFSFQSMMIHYAKAVKKYGASDTLRQTFEQALKEHFAAYPDDFFLATFLDNHDIDRFLFSIGGDAELLKEALQIQLAFPHPAIIYNGTELGLTNRAAIDRDFPYSDVMVRQLMPWEWVDHSTKNNVHRKANEIRTTCREAVKKRRKKFGK